MKFYKLNNTWVSWDELHNGYGYTTEPSIAVTYKSAHNGSSWGEDAGSGYYVGDIDDMVHGSFWCDSDYGWFELDGLVWNPEIYPSNATPLMMQNGGLTSQAVSLESDGVTYYLIKAIVADTGWITADEAAELGWEVYDEMQGTFIVFDTVENKIVSAFTNELTYGEIEGIVLQSPKLVYGVDITVPTAQFWFTANGRNETENRALNTGNPLYTEDGVRLLPSTHSDYIGAIPLSFMEVDGDMFMADSDPENNYVRLVNDSLNLYIKPGIPIRDESAWAVQFERIFTLSFANTQLPGITITMPADETGYKGTSITLPTMTGEYESGGKTWKPSAWDIGAFGSSYSLTGDVVAHLVFTEVVQYTEITLYGNVSSTISCQNNVTSGFTGNVNTSNVLQLYTDDTYTTPWNGYDYSNDYEMGLYVDGVWYSRGGTIADLPSTTANPGNGETVSKLFILLDTGCLWFVCNNSNNGYGYNNLHAYFYGTITLRIYPKGQQWIPVFPYNPSYGEYDNLSTNRKGTFVRKSSPATVFGTFPAIAESFGYKSGMIKSTSIQAELQISQAVLYLNVVGNPALSNIIVRFENDICTGYVRSDKADLPTAPSYDGATYTLKDDNGNSIDYDDSFTYKFVLLLNSTGDTVGGTTSTGSMIKSSTGKLQVRVRYMSSKFNRVWYYRIPIS